MIGLDRLAEVPAGLLLVMKATAVLAAARLAHAALARANPRWRVLTWRAAVAGLAAVAGIALAPPLITWRVPASESVARPPTPLPTMEPERSADDGEAPVAALAPITVAEKPRPDPPATPAFPPVDVGEVVVRPERGP